MDEQHLLLNALGGLLHDIGKFAQRGGEGFSRIWDDQAEEDFKYKHALHTYDFVERYLPDPWKTKVKLLAAHHHRPNNAEETVVQIADFLASGERTGEIDSSEDLRARHPKQLRSIFNSIMISDATPAGTTYFPLAPLSLQEDVIFPADSQVSDQVWEDYERMWNEFCLEANKLKEAHSDGENLSTYLESMLSLMQRYTWSIPAAYFNAVPDISLYDHSRVTAALAMILAENDPSVEELQRLKTNFGDVDEDIALLIGGDISGVQNFIYTLSSKKAAQTLRGRSFYLQLLTEAIMRYVMRNLDLPATNVIYSGGGHFYLIAPLSAEDGIENLRQEITKTLLDYHGASLYLALGTTRVPASGFRVGQFSSHWARMHQSVALAKQQRYTELGDELYTMVFQIKEHGGNQEDTCSVCGEERKGTSQLDEEDRICPMCSSFVDNFGVKLPYNKFIALHFGESQRDGQGSGLDVLRAFGMGVQWLEDADATFSLDATNMKGVIWALDDAVSWLQGFGVPMTNWLHYTVRRTPSVSNREEAEEINKELTKAERQEDPARQKNPKTFTHLQAQAHGIKRLGVLRMDVDNLGDIFIQGFHIGERDISTLGRLSTLSFQLSLFFEGWVKKLCQEGEREGKIYAVYAGGDDVFLIGPWDLMPELAHQIQMEFKRFAADHPAAHLSAGMSFIRGKYPVYQAAEDAKNALDMAKDLKGKNAFGFLGQPWRWDDFERLKEKAESIDAIVRQGAEQRGPNAIIQILRQLAEQQAQARQGEDDDKLLYGPWLWRGAYMLRRMEDRYANKQELKAKIERIRTNLDENNFGDLAQWGVAARWVQLIHRETKKGA